MPPDTQTPDADQQHILSTLTEEERAAIGESDYTEGQVASMQRLAAGAEADADDDDVDEVLDADGNVVVDPAKAAAPAPAPAAAAPAPAPAAAAPAPAAEAPAAAPAPAPRAEPQTPVTYRAELPADYDDQVKQLKADRDTLAAKFKAGEIDVDAYNAENDKLIEKRDDLAALKTKADISREMEAQHSKRNWEEAGIRLAERVLKDDGFDYRTDDAKRSKLNLVLKSMAEDPDLESLTFDELLSRAHVVAKTIHGWPSKTAAAPSPTPAAAPAAAAPAPAARKPPVDALPKSLAGVPGGDGPGDVGGEFDEIDKLDGEAYEAALERMTPAMRTRYLHSR